ncbi:MAG: glycosyltransferase [Chitinophagaceae bacterium]|nr:glycosyltransferase [Chitinophagaceae bacterium]
MRYKYFFSIVVSTYNRPVLLKSCLNSIQAAISVTEGASIEVIVTDDSDNDESMILLHQNFPLYQYIKGTRRGPAANRNNGAKKAEGEWIVFIDDDVIVSLGLLSTYKKAISKNPECIAFEGAIHPDSWDLVKNDLYECPVNICGGLFWSANICVKKSYFDQIQGFDEQFLLAAQEDQDIFLRLKKISEIPFLEQAFVIHPVRKVKLFKSLQQIYVTIKNYVLFITKHKLYKNIISLIYSKFLDFLSIVLKRKNILIIVDDFYRFIIGLPIMIFFFIKNKYFANN